MERRFHSPRPIAGFKTGDMGLGHYVVTMDDAEESLRFYRDTLGFRISTLAVSRETPGQPISMAFFHVNPRHHSMAFNARQDPPRRLGHWMMQMNDLDDVGFTYDLVQQRGIPIRTPLGKHGNDQMTSFYMISPSGFAVEVGWCGIEIDDATWVAKANDAGRMWGCSCRMGSQWAANPLAGQQDNA